MCGRARVCVCVCVCVCACTHVRAELEPLSVLCWPQLCGVTPQVRWKLTISAGTGTQLVAPDGASKEPGTALSGWRWVLGFFCLHPDALCLLVH